MRRLGRGGEGLWMGVEGLLGGSVGDGRGWGGEWLGKYVLGRGVEGLVRSTGQEKRCVVEVKVWLGRGGEVKAWFGEGVGLGGEGLGKIGKGLGRGGEGNGEWWGRGVGEWNSLGGLGKLVGRQGLGR